MNDITQPLRLATGTHEAGSGKGCAMNVISWENGDTVITDYPSCSARPLARLVQSVNDAICSHADDGFLCPECSLTVLNLGHATTGTAGATPQQKASWTAELLDSPEWGISRLASGSTHETVVRVAGLFRESAAGNEPSAAEWRAAVRGVTNANALTIAGYTNAAAYDAVAYGICGSDANAAYYAAVATANTAIATAHYAAATANAAAAAASNAARVEHCRSAIAAWHRICGTAPAVPEPAVTEQAVRAMGAK